MNGLALVINIFLPGIGTLIAGKVGQGIGQLALYWIGVLFTVTMIGAVIGLPMMFAAWIWAIVSVAGSSSSPSPVNVTVIQQHGATGAATVAGGPEQVEG
jgi:TM2 domain-containing membrane protein YozV